MAKKYVESKYSELRTLNRVLILVQGIESDLCKDIFGMPKPEIKNKIYDKISEVAKK